MGENEEKEEGDTGNNIRIQHRDIVQELYGLFLPAPEIENAYGSQGAEQGRGRRGDYSNDESTLESIHKRLGSRIGYRKE